MYQESAGFGEQLAKMFPTVDATKELMEQERAQTAKRAHRKLDLEWLACTLQTTVTREMVLNLIDTLRTELPPESKQDDDMRLWRLLLHRIDSRNWVVTGETADGYLKIESSVPAVDIQELIARAKPEIDRNIDLQNLLFWGMGLFYPRGDAQSPDPNSWKEHLTRAQSFRAAFVSRGDEMADRLEKSAIAFVATVCVRDHWPELNAAEQSWCAEVLCEAVEQDADNIDDLMVAGRNRMDGSRPAAYVLRKCLVTNFHQNYWRAFAQPLVSQSDTWSMRCVYSPLWASEHLSGHRIATLWLPVFTR